LLRFFQAKTAWMVNGVVKPDNQTPTPMRNYHASAERKHGNRRAMSGGILDAVRDILNAGDDRRGQK